MQPFWEGWSSVPCATNAVEFSVSCPCRDWGFAGTKSTGGQTWLDLPGLPCPGCQEDLVGAWGPSRLNLWFKEEQTPVHSRVWFECGTQHVTCSAQPGGPWGGLWGGPSCRAVPATPPLSRSSPGAGPGSEPAAVSVRRSQRHQAGPAATSPADDAISVPQVVLIHSSSDSTSSCSRVQCK